MKILVVDNNKNDRMLISKMLRVDGYDVLEASNGVEALRLLENVTPNLLISNISMPGMDGFTLLLRLKKNSKTNIIPFVFYTETYVSDEDKELGLSLGASRYLLRSLGPKEFLCEIKSVLKEFKAGKVKPRKPIITEEDYLEKYSQRISQTLDCEIDRIDREIKKRRIAREALQEEITEGQKKEEQLLSASLHLRSLIEASLDPFLTINPEGKITDVNKATEEVTGVQREKLIGTDFPDYFTEPETAREGYKEAFIKGFVRDYPLAIRHKSGIITDVLYNAAVYRNGRGEVEGVFAAARDSTERKRIEDAMKFAKEEAECSSRIKSEILEKMAHELRTPLNAILGFNELMRTKKMGELNEKQELYVNGISDGANHLLCIINDILDFVKVESGENLHISIESFLAPEAIDQTLAFLSERTGHKNIIIKKEIDPELGTISADKIRFGQILLNLLDNAIKFSKPHGGTILITARKAGDMAQFSICDTGIGIREADMVNIFSLFCRADSGRSRKYGGIGLAVIKQLVEQHGGRIWVQSKYGEGTTFTFTMPIGWGKNH